MKETDFSYTCIFVEDEFSVVKYMCLQTSVCTQPGRERINITPEQQLRFQIFTACKVELVKFN